MQNEKQQEPKPERTRVSEERLTKVFNAWQENGKKGLLDLFSRDEDETEN
jgi:hypothetical protein